MLILNYSKALDELGLKRYCCRRMVLTHVDLISKLLNYNSKNIAIVFKDKLNENLQSMNMKEIDCRLFVVAEIVVVKY